MHKANLKFCRICGGENIKPFFDLGSQPLANSLLKKKNEKEDYYPLALCWCPDCSLTQLNYTVDPKKLFSNYVWVTGTSKMARDFAEQFYKELVLRTQNAKNGYVLEIASNDGTFLLPFQRDGYSVLGVDPAQNIVEIAEQNGVPTRCLFWGSEAATRILTERGPARIIFARNVLPHVANTEDFVRGLSLALYNEGTLAIEVHYAGTILEGLQYDSIYHEHLCYFTLKPLEYLLNKFGLFVFDIEESPISGGSLIVYAKKQKVDERPKVWYYRNKESSNNINSLKKWEDFAKRSYEHRDKILKILNKIVKSKKTMVGWGASARSSTMLNFCGINSSIISTIADQNRLKQGLFTAGSHISINDPDTVMKINPKFVVLLAWNFAEEIIENLERKFKYSDNYIIPLPNEPRIKKSSLST